VVIKCTLSALQKIQYRQLSYATLRTRDDKGNLKTTAYNNTIMRLRQVCNHPYLMNDKENDGWDLGPAMRVRACGKLDVLDRILPKLKMAGHRVLIYSQMVQLLEILAEYIDEQGYKYFKLVGATSSDVRAQMIEEFNRPDSDTFLFILSTRAGGQGVNLQTADTVIIFDSDWNPMMDEQARLCLASLLVLCLASASPLPRLCLCLASPPLAPHTPTPSSSGHPRRLRRHRGGLVGAGSKRRPRTPRTFGDTIADFFADTRDTRGGWAGACAWSTGQGAHQPDRADEADAGDPAHDARYRRGEDAQVRPPTLPSPVKPPAGCLGR